MAGIADVAKNAGIDAEGVKAVLDAIKSISTRESVTIQGFGTFKTVSKPARMAPNPQKPGEKVAVPAKSVLQFKAAKPSKAAK